MTHIERGFLPAQRQTLFTTISNKPVGPLLKKYTNRRKPDRQIETSIQTHSLSNTNLTCSEESFSEMETVCLLPLLNTSLHYLILPSLHCLLSACWLNQFPDTTYPVSPLSYQLSFSLLLSDHHPLLHDSPLSNTHRWPLNKRLCLVSTLLSTTLMTPLFRTAPRRRTNFTFLPSHSLSPLHSIPHALL